MPDTNAAEDANPDDALEGRAQDGPGVDKVALGKQAGLLINARITELVRTIKP